MQVDEAGQMRIAGKSVRFWIVTGFLVVLILTVLSLIVQYALIKINHQSENGLSIERLTTRVLQDNGEEKDITTIFGITFVPRSAVQLITRGEDTETYTPLENLSFLGVTDITVQPRKQRALEKVGAEGLGCEVVNRYGAFSYNCSNVQRILKFNRPDNGPWRIGLVEDSPIQQFTSIRYRDGLLDFSNEFGTFIVEYRELGAPLATVASLPISNPEDAERDLMLITNKTDKDQRGFAILNRQRGELFYYSDLKDNQAPEQFQRKVKINTTFDASLCSMNTKQIACYYGPTSHPPDSHDETEHRKDAILPTLEFYDPHSQQRDPSKSLPIKGIEGIDTVYMIKDGTLFAASDEKLYLLKQESDAFQAKLINPDVSSVDNGESLSFIRDDKLYRYDTGTHETHLVFTSKNLRLGNVQAMGKQVLFNAYVQNMPGNITHTYSVTDAPTAASRLEDKLPYADQSLPITLMDYDSQHIYVRLAVGVISDKKTGKMSADPESFQRAKYIVTERLRADGLLKHNPKLIFDF